TTRRPGASCSRPSSRRPRRSRPTAGPRPWPLPAPSPSSATWRRRAVPDLRRPAPEPVPELDRARIELGQQLRALRRGAGLSGVELAGRAAMSQAKISKLETGQTTPSVEDAERLAGVFGATPAQAAALVDQAKALAIQLLTWRARRRQSLF